MKLFVQTFSDWFWGNCEITNDGIPDESPSFRYKPYRDPLPQEDEKTYIELCIYNYTGIEMKPESMGVSKGVKITVINEKKQTPYNLRKRKRGEQSSVVKVSSVKKIRKASPNHETDDNSPRLTKEETEKLVQENQKPVRRDAAQ